MANGKVVPGDFDSPKTDSRGGNGSGSGSLIQHRLDKLEEQVGKIEDTLKEVNGLCIAINTKMENKASETYVLNIFSITLGLLVVSIFAHIGIRVLSLG